MFIIVILLYYIIFELCHYILNTHKFINKCTCFTVLLLYSLRQDLIPSAGLFSAFLHFTESVV